MAPTSEQSGLTRKAKAEIDRGMDRELHTLMDPVVQRLMERAGSEKLMVARRPDATVASPNSDAQDQRQRGFESPRVSQDFAKIVDRREREANQTAKRV
jgi:hypothetical protein